MGSMTFSVFLIANGGEGLYDYLQSIETIETIPDTFFNLLCEKLKMYFVAGAEPDFRWLQERTAALVDGRLAVFSVRTSETSASVTMRRTNGGIITCLRAL